MVGLLALLVEIVMKLSQMDLLSRIDTWNRSNLVGRRNRPTGRRN